jgi:RNA polymerase sigma-70 factor (ECF subfamily)
MPHSEHEGELIQRAQSGDLEAFCLLAERYERKIYSLAIRFCQNRQDAEDISQEVWLKAARALSAFRGESSFYTWLRRIAINSFLNEKRRTVFRWRGQSTEVELLCMDDIDESRYTNARESEAGLQRSILMERVARAMSELSAQQRLILILKHYEGMTYEEIASLVGCSCGAAKKSVNRSICKLRKILVDEIPGCESIPCAAISF